jgi:hypothetical protein
MSKIRIYSADLSQWLVYSPVVYLHPSQKDQHPRSFRTIPTASEHGDGLKSTRQNVNMSPSAQDPTPAPPVYSNQTPLPASDVVRYLGLYLHTGTLTEVLRKRTLTENIDFRCDSSQLTTDNNKTKIGFLN